MANEPDEAEQRKLQLKATGELTNAVNRLTDTVDRLSNNLRNIESKMKSGGDSSK